MEGSGRASSDNLNKVNQKKNKKKNHLFVEKHGTNNTKSIYVVVPLEKHLQVSVHELQQHLAGFLKRDQLVAYRDFQKLLESLCSIQFLDVKRQLKKNFSQFGRASRGEPMLCTQDEEGPSKRELDQGEQKFIEDFIYLIKVSHYEHLRQVEWEEALKYTYIFNLPVQINYSNMDQKMLGTYWDSKKDEEDQDELFEHRDRILIYYRGIGVTRCKDYFIKEKIDLLVEYLIADPFSELCEELMYVYNKLFKRESRKQAMDRKQTLEYNTSKARENVILNAKQQSGHGHNDFFNCQLIERRTLHQVLYNWRQILKFSFMQIEIQEPTFKDVIILYRKTQDKPKGKICQEEKNQKRNMQIKMFTEIPMADLEMIFPQKNVMYKPLTIVTITITVIIAMITFFYILIQEELKINTVFSAMSLFGFKLYQSYTGAEKEKNDMQNRMNELTYDRVKNSQEGVLFQLIEDMNDEFFKEVLLVYTLLLSKGLKSLHREQSNGVFSSFNTESLNGSGQSSSFKQKKSQRKEMTRDIMSKRSFIQRDNGHLMNHMEQNDVFGTLESQNSGGIGVEVQPAVLEGMTQKELEMEIEHMVKERFKQRIDFDINFALKHMHQFEILDKTTNEQGEEVYSAKPLNIALDQLKAMYEMHVNDHSGEEITNLKEKMENNFLKPKKKPVIKAAASVIGKAADKSWKHYKVINEARTRAYGFDYLLDQYP